MELVEADLSTHITRGAARRRVDRQTIAEALKPRMSKASYDLKPANIKVRADSTVKVLDFIAKPWALAHRQTR